MRRCIVNKSKSTLITAKFWQMDSRAEQNTTKKAPKLLLPSHNIQMNEPQEWQKLSKTTPPTLLLYKTSVLLYVTSQEAAVTVLLILAEPQRYGKVNWMK